MTDMAPTLVEAVVLLHPLAGGKIPSPAQSRLTADSVLQSAIRETGLHPEGSAIFDNLNAFSVRAEKPFLDAIARAKEVAQVLPNASPSLGLIAPIERDAGKVAKA